MGRLLMDAFLIFLRSSFLFILLDVLFSGLHEILFPQHTSIYLIVSPSSSYQPSILQLLNFILFFFFFFTKYSQGWSFCVAEDDLETLILLPPPHKN